MSAVNVTMQCNRGWACTGFMEHPPMLVDAQDGKLLYEILDSAKNPDNEHRWYEYRSSK